MAIYQRNNKEIPLKSSVWNVLSDGEHNVVIQDVAFIEKTKSGYLMELTYETEEGNTYSGNVFVDYNPNSVFSQITRIATQEGAEVLSTEDLVGIEFTIILQTKGSWQNIVGVMPIDEEEERPKKKSKKKKKTQCYEYDEDDY